MSEPDEATKGVMAAMLLEDRLNAEEAGDLNPDDRDSDSDYGTAKKRRPAGPSLCLHPSIKRPAARTELSLHSSTALLCPYSILFPPWRVLAQVVRRGGMHAIRNGGLTPTRPPENYTCSFSSYDICRLQAATPVRPSDQSSKQGASLSHRQGNRSRCQAPPARTNSPA